MITQSELKQILHYDLDTGLFTWLVDKSRAIKAGTVAKNLNQKGYCRIKINGQEYLAHRLAWLYVNGVMPKDGIDHINNIKTDNKITNLREATHSQNMRNRLLTVRNNTGYKGVSFCKRAKKFKVGITFNNKQIHLGYFSDAKSASLAYESYGKKLHGEFYCDGNRL
jgi:hypothetical protein